MTDMVTSFVAAQQIGEDMKEKNALELKPKEKMKLPK